MPVLIDARMAIRGLGIATFVERLLSGFAADPSADIVLWKGSGGWDRRGRLSTLTRSGLFDISPRWDPRTRNFSVVHFVGNVGSMRPGPNSVLTVHDLLYRRGLRGRDRLTGSLLERCIPRAGRVVAGSRRTCSDIEEAFPEMTGKVEVIPNGMRRLPRPEGKRRHIVTFGGGSDPRKRTGLMVAAYRSYLTTTADPLPLVVLTRAGLTDQQRQELVALGVRFVNTATDAEVGRLMAEASVLLYPTAEEGFGLPILEAAEVGTPVVMDGSARVAEEVIGPHCFPVEGEDPEAWADGLRRAVAGGPVFGSLALPDWEAVARSYLRLYDEVRP